MAANPFVAESRFIKGYESQSLWNNCSFIEAILLHFLPDLPSLQQRRAVEKLFIGIMNLGPRDVDNRSAMTAGVSKTRAEHLLPIGLLAGQKAATDVQLAHHFIKKHCHQAPEQWCQQNNQADDFSTPGFGTVYGSICPIMKKLAADISLDIPDSSTLNWCNNFVSLLNHQGKGWLAPGITAAVCLSLGLGAKESLGLYQLAKSVGIVAFGIEQSHRPMSKAPMLSDEFYEHTP